MNNKKIQIGVAAALVFVVLLMLNPFHVWVHNFMTVLVVTLLVVLFGAYSIFISLERGGDERESSHKMLAGRAAFFAGGLVLLIGIVIQSFEDGGPDPWLVFALAAMVFVKIGFRYYSEYKW